MATSQSYPDAMLDETNDANAASQIDVIKPVLPSSITSPNIQNECSEQFNIPKDHIRLPNEADALPSDCKDLLNRLLEYTPEHRIRSLFSLQRIAFYKGYNFDHVKKQKVIALS